MHLNFDFTASQILWTFTFAGLLVLLVVLLGRDRMRRFPWFTTGIVLMALRLLASRLLFGRLPSITLSEIFVTLGDLVALVSLLVIIEVARRAFSSVRRQTWIGWTLVLVAVGATVLAVWGPWPAWKTLIANSTIGVLQLMQLVAQKGELLVDVLTVQLGLLVVLFGRRFKAGWRSHTQQIMIGLSAAATMHLAVQGIWELIALKAVPHSQAEYERILGLRDKLFNANGAVYAAVLVWWIVCLWIDEPGTKAAGAPPLGKEVPAEIPPAIETEESLPEAGDVATE